MADSKYIFYSKETRWFFREEQKSLEQWFNDHQAFFDEAAGRTDYYLRMPVQQNIGYKLREGKTEIKMRLGEDESREFLNGHKAVVNNWVKWSLELKSKADSPDQLYTLDKSAFLELNKKRVLVTFEVSVDHSVQIINPGDHPAEGCQVELTELIYKDQTWYSFGFEAFGENANLDRNFKLVTNRVMSEIQQPKLTIEASFSYPSFLLELQP